VVQRRCAQALGCLVIQGRLRGGDDHADAADPRPSLGAKIFNT